MFSRISKKYSTILDSDTWQSTVFGFCTLGFIICALVALGIGIATVLIIIFEFSVWLGIFFLATILLGVLAIAWITFEG